MNKDTNQLNLPPENPDNPYQEFLNETQEEINPTSPPPQRQKSSDFDSQRESPNLEKPKRSLCERFCSKGWKRVSKQPRQIFNDGEVFPLSSTTNVMNNRKYNIFFFLPMFLWEQYKYFGNLYFLLLAITQFFDKLKVGFMITYIGPIIIILGFSLAKEIWDHYNTWRKDEEYNREKFEVLRDNQWRLIDSAKIKVGDLVRLRKKQRVPADMIYLGYSKAQRKRSMQGSHIGSELSLTQNDADQMMRQKKNFASTFVTTDQLDGETDLKPRESLKFTYQLLEQGEFVLTDSVWKVDVEIPNEQIYSFKGILSFEGGREAVKLKNTLWMGMKVTTNGVVGMVIFNGKETKMAMNSRKKTSKMGRTDIEIDRIILALFFILTSISILITMCSGNFYNWDSLFYLLRILILLSSIIPISMRVLIDFAKIFYCIEIRKDKEMPNTVTRNSGIPEELARIEYLLSDKTGTLTRNEMIFREFRTKTIEVKTSDFTNLQKFLGGRRSNRTSNIYQLPTDKHDAHKNYPFDSSDLISDNSSRLSSHSKKNTSFKAASQRNIFSQYQDQDIIQDSHSNMYDRNSLSKQEMRDHLEQRILGFLLCNNVKVSKDEEGVTSIQGASPDELCIVDFARSLNYEISSRSKHHVCLRNLQGIETKYSILKEFAFSSERKRMGIIVSKSVNPGSGTNHQAEANEDAEVTFILKGADSIMINFMSNSEHQQYIRETTEDLAKQGFRTLVYGSKSMSKKEYNDWQRRVSLAEQNQMQMELAGEQVEKGEVEQLRNELEKGLNFLCVTGVEDLLREGVRSSITSFREAGIKVWMLTGDKLETAKCVSICTGFKSENQEFLNLSGETKEEIEFKLDRLEGDSLKKSASLAPNSNFYMMNYNNFQINPHGDVESQQMNAHNDQQATSSPNKISINDKCLVISGDTLDLILKDKTLKAKFLIKAPLASSVVLCRCAPKQKSLIASLLKKKLKKIVCSVGDGGNDVGMIQASSLGIGIEGREGRQAALASDISVVEFSHLQQLLFWHGRLSYLRTSKLCNFVIHRGIIVTVIQAMFILTYYFVSISIYNGLTLLGYSTIFTTLPIFMLILDKDLPREQALNYPILYKYLQQGRNLNPLVFLSWLFQSIFQGSFVLLTGLFFYHELSFSKIVTTTFLALLTIGKTLIKQSQKITYFYTKKKIYVD